ncbi:MAG TPA: replication initiation protein [Victivallales bacterium]|nr:replication initiation protein [Victivallales bacterium]
MNKIVRMHNNFIEACYKCTLTEKKLLLLGIHKFNKLAGKEVDKGKIYQTQSTQKELKDIIGLDTKKDFTQIKNACKALNEKVVALVNKDNKEFETFSMITDTKLKNGILELGFHWKIFPYFTELKERFTKYDLINVKEFSGVYSVRFYELIKQYENIGHRTIKVETLRKWFLLEKKYPRYNDMKTYVIQPAYKELKEKSELYFEYEQNTQGRKIVSITLDIKLNIRQREKTYITKRLKEYFNIRNLKDFSEDLYTYFQEKKDSLSTEDTKYITGLILSAKKETLNIKMISKTLIFNFFNWLEPDLGF